MKNYLTFAQFALATIPTKDDWQKKIDELINNYYNKTIFLPRKKKKKAKKEALKELSFLKAMKDYTPSFAL